MKKHNSFYCLVFLLCISIIVQLSGCKSSPESYTVHPMDLLDLNSEFYITIPLQADPDLITYFCANNLKNISSDTTKQLVDRIDTIYCGINHKKKNYYIQAAIDENLPRRFVSNKLSKNKLFTKQKNEINLINYDIFTFNDIDLSFPSNNIALVGRNVPEMLSTYDTIRSSGFGNNVWENEEIYNYLKSAEDEIRFYTNKPKTFLSLLIGHQIDLHLNTVSGNFKIDSEHPKQYIVELTMEFQNDKFLKASKTLIGMAFGLTGSEIKALNSNTLIVSNIQIKKEQLYKILVL